VIRPSCLADKVAVPGLNCAHQNLPYIQVLTAQRERQKLGLCRRSKLRAGMADSAETRNSQSDPKMVIPGDARVMT
jgi:hypothetical protein